MANKYMNSPKSIAIKSKHLTVDATEHQYYLANREDKLAVLTRLFEIEDITRAIIFVRTRVATSDLVNKLMGRGFPAEALNGDLNQQTREQVLNRFRRNQITILVATDIAARGLDISDISHVFNYDLPEDPELYVHRVGRTGRAGKTGIAISILTMRELWRLHRIEGFTKQEITRRQIPTAEEIEEHRETQLLEQMMIGLRRGRYQKELQMVNKLADIGHDPLEIAAIAVKLARKEEQQRPIEQINEVQEGRPQKSRRKTKSVERRQVRNGANRSPRKGMVRLTLGAGRSHGVRPSDVVGTLAYHAKFPGKTIGAISILDKHTLVDVPQEYLEQTLAKSGEYQIHKKTVTLKLA
jgi:ATP-dependent RNA helicase DeaD